MRPLLIASLGNPGSSYAHTLHSAGHTLVGALQRHTGAAPFVKDRKYGNGLTSHGGAGITLWQSTSYMNDSGPGLAAAWRAFCSSASAAGEPPRLVVVYDDMELACGKFNVKGGAGKSARGHNGLKSLLGVSGMKTVDFSRVGVGIGPRPLSREPDEVARFVLRKMTAAQRGAVEGLAEPVWEACLRL